MNKILEQLLKSRNWGAITFDRKLRVVQIDNTATQILQSLKVSAKKENIIDLFPELIGIEDFIQQIIASQTDSYRLDYINRTDKSGQEKYLNLIVLALEIADSAFVLIEDVTDQARALKALNQQRYDLLLYQRNQEFRREFLRNSILGNSDAIQRIRDTIQKVSKVPPATVLLVGETGTGKNLAARVIHHSSMPPDAPFVHVNCAALPEHLIEAELFGYQRGAFTHAIASKPGLFEEARNGTIFLDEIGELPINMQAKLLSVLETKEVRRLGSNKSIELKARIISATNKDLQKGVIQKTFREDLYYRLNVVLIHLPPLRDLGNDIILIAEHLLKMFNIELNKRVAGFSPEAKTKLLKYAWPGNVRELSNCLERTMIFIEKETIGPEDLTLFNQERSLTLKDTQQITLPPGGIVLDDLERQLITAALKQTDNNKSQAARLLGLTRDTLRYRLEKFKLI